MAAALCAGLLVSGCGSGEAAAPAGGTGDGGGSQSRQPMKQRSSMEERSQMREQQRRMRGGEDGSMRRHEGETMRQDRDRRDRMRGDRMRGDENMTGNDRHRMQRGRHGSM